MKNNYQTNEEYDAQQVLDFNAILKKEYSIDIFDFMELEDAMLDMYNLFSDIAEGIEVAEENIKIDNYDPGGSAPTNSAW